MSDAVEEFGPYLVYERLGQGGMATVHRAEKRGVGIRRPIALKRLLPHVAADPALVKLFVDEARLASHLHHTNVAQTFELGRVGETFFIAMEYASGPTLAQIVRQCQHAACELPLSIIVQILGQICEALDYAHNLCDESGRPLRIVHRDVSPANIIVTHDGIVKLIDFGIAKATISSVKTQTGFIKGKFGYIAPEYITGKIDSRVDLFAVGVVAHEVMSGRRLFEGKDDFETLANIREMNLLPPSRWNPRVTADLDDIVMTALQRDPALRWQSAGAMQVALANAARQLGTVVGNPQLAEWVAWAFDQVASETGQMTGVSAADTDAFGRRAPRPDSSLSIEVSQVASEALETPRPGLAMRPEPTPSEVTADDEPDEPDDEPEPFHLRPPSDSDETVPLERVALTPHDLALLTPSPVIAPPPPVAAPSPQPTRPSRGHEVAPPPSRGHEAAPPPSRGHEAAPPQMAAPPPRVAAPQPRVAAPPQMAAPPPVVAPPSRPSRPSRPFEAVAPPTPPRRSARPALPFMGASPTPPRPARAQEPMAPPLIPPVPPPIPPPLRPPRSSRAMPMATGPPPVASSRELEVLAAPALPQPLRQGGTLSGMPPPPPVPSSRELAVLPAEPAVPAAVEPRPAPAPAVANQKVKSRNKSTQKMRPEPRPAGAVVRAPAADAGTGPIRGRRHLVWLILLMLALGGGAMAVAYYWPDLVDR
ncbi:MAG TPA: serine/threonine-protein kinase [Kofleriaceae bacterium]